ncbi:chromosome segregation ATPases-like [Oleiphilus messinensis]|uniref:Chromosome segregation ATPases-like n=1 Tax=Oleiphilus messinensis TaxID=141451 RepID=A0A1Y0I8J6_9GAMM|nr:DNA-binding protein [Oleiphilus messinensis]ARU56832.1 chromosome segregation ATPases-like [Oleiphilus messinensis]
MARIGVTFDDIAQAADLIETQGEKPTVDRVREVLGTGSKSTIAPLLKRWHAEKANIPDVSEIPKPLLDALKTVYQQTHDLATARVDEAQLVFDEKQKAANNAVVMAQQELATHRDEIIKLKAEISSLTTENNQLKEQQQEDQILITKLETEKAAALNQTLALNTRIKEYKSEIHDIRSSVEHYQERVVQEREYEREQHRINLQHYRDQTEAALNSASTLQQQVSTLDCQLTDKRTAMAELTEELNGCQKAHLACQSELNCETQSLNYLRAQYEMLETRHSDIENEREELKQAYNTLKAEHAEKVIKLDLLQQANNVLTLDLQEHKSASDAMRADLSELNIIKARLEAIVEERSTNRSIRR